MKRHFKERTKGGSKTGFTLVVVVQSGGSSTCLEYLWIFTRTLPAGGKRGLLDAMFEY